MERMLKMQQMLELVAQDASATLLAGRCARLFDAWRYWAGRAGRYCAWPVEQVVLPAAPAQAELWDGIFGWGEELELELEPEPEPEPVVQMASPAGAAVDGAAAGRDGGVASESVVPGPGPVAVAVPFARGRRAERPTSTNNTTIADPPPSSDTGSYIVIGSLTLVAVGIACLLVQRVMRRDKIQPELMSGRLSNANPIVTQAGDSDELMSGRLSNSNPIVTQASDSNVSSRVSLRPTTTGEELNTAPSAPLYGTQAGGGAAADAGVVSVADNVRPDYVEPGTVHNVGLTQMSVAPNHMTTWDEATGHISQAWLLVKGSFILAARKTDVTDQVARLIENDHEAHVMHTGNAAPQHSAPSDGEQLPTSASPQSNFGSGQLDGLKRGLHPSEDVIAQLKCVSFEGFPDWGNLCRGQERHGECALALIGPTSPVPDAQTPLVRVVFVHAGALVRNASGTEVERRACCKRFARAEWKCGREQENSVGSIHTYSQLLSISTFQLDSTYVKKVLDSFSVGCALGFLCRAVVCIPVVWYFSYILSFLWLRASRDEENTAEERMR